MTRRIALLQGHPDPAPERLCRALAAAYAEGARASGHEVREIEAGASGVPLLTTEAEFQRGTPPPAIAAAQETLRWAEHWVLVYPLWLGDVPAAFKGFLEQVFRPGFALEYRPDAFPRRLLTGRSARIVVTMGMPAAAYRYLFFAHSLASLRRNVLEFSGVRPVATTLIGSVGPDFRDRARARLDDMAALGRRGA